MLGGTAAAAATATAGRWFFKSSHSVSHGANSLLLGGFTLAVAGATTTTLAYNHNNDHESSSYNRSSSNRVHCEAVQPQQQPSTLLRRVRYATISCDTISCDTISYDTLYCILSLIISWTHTVLDLDLTSHSLICAHVTHNIHTYTTHHNIQYTMNTDDSDWSLYSFIRNCL